MRAPRSTLLRHAVEMRRTPTPAERKLWQALRAGQVAGVKFRRQVPVGPYIVDFLSHSLRLVIEVDGSTHGEPDKDAQRIAWLNGEGLRVLRVWNNEVLNNLDGVLQVIIGVIEARLALTPSPGPLPQGEGEKRAVR